MIFYTRTLSDEYLVADNENKYIFHYYATSIYRVDIENKNIKEIEIDENIKEIEIDDCAKIIDYTVGKVNGIDKLFVFYKSGKAGIFK